MKYQSYLNQLEENPFLLEVRLVADIMPIYSYIAKS